MCICFMVLLDSLTASMISGSPAQHSQVLMLKRNLLQCLAGATTVAQASKITCKLSVSITGNYGVKHACKATELPSHVFQAKMPLD